MTNEDQALPAEFVERVRAHRDQREANKRAVQDGSADPRVYEVLKRVYPVADTAPPDWRESMRLHAASLVTDEFDRATENSEPFEPDVVAAKLSSQVEAAVENLEKARRSIRRLTTMSNALSWLPVIGAPLSVLGGLKLEDVQSDIAEARRPLPQPPSGGPTTDWLEAYAERTSRQTDALERMADLAEAQAKVGPIFLYMAVIAAVAAVVAAITGIILVVLAA